MGWMNKIRMLVGFFLLLSFVSGPVPEAFSQPAVRIEGIRPGPPLASVEMARILENHLQKMIQNPSRKVAIGEFRGYEQVIVPRGSFSCQVLVPEKAIQGGNIAGMMVFFANGREIRKIRFSARVEIYADVLVPRHFLKKHHEIQADDIQIANKNIAALPQDVITEEKEVLGKRTTLAINNQEALRLSMLELPPMVNKGDRVILMIENDQFKITAVGEVREVGRKGDRIKLINLSSKKEVYGRVRDANTVQVDF
jgi:flagella basal body P-ring formation protein FlgA